MASAETLFIWITFADSRVCPDCLLIEAFQPEEGRPLSEWIGRGLPAAGHTVCGDFCRCILVENNYLETEEGGELRQDRFVLIEWTSEGLAQVGVTPEKIQEFKQLLFKAQYAGFSDAELYEMLYGLDIEEMNEALQSAIDRSGIGVFPKYRRIWPERWKSNVPGSVRQYPE